jgi:hypothetical protein
MASRTEVGETRIWDSIWARLFKMGSKTVTLAADNYAINANDPPVIFIDPAAAARDVLLPAVADAPNAMFLIFNTSDNATGTEDITLKTSADGAISPSPVISKNEGALVVNDGTSGRAIVGANT